MIGQTNIVLWSTRKNQANQVPFIYHLRNILWSMYNTLEKMNSRLFLIHEDDEALKINQIGNFHNIAKIRVEEDNVCTFPVLRMDWVLSCWGLRTCVPTRGWALRRVDRAGRWSNCNSPLCYFWAIAWARNWPYYCLVA